MTKQEILSAVVKANLFDVDEEILNKAVESIIMTEILDDYDEGTYGN